MRRTVAHRLLSLTRPVLPPLAASLLFRVLGLLAGVALLAVAVGGVVRVVTDGPGAVSASFLGTLAGLAVLKGLSRYLEQFAGHAVAFRALALLRVHFFRELEPQAPAATDGRRTGDLLARVTRDIDRVEVFFAHTLVPAVAAVLTPLAVVVVLAVQVDVVLAGVAAVAFVLAGLVLPRRRAALTADLADAARVHRGDLAQHVTDSTQGVREVLAFDAADARLDELDRLGEQSAAGMRRAGAAVAFRRGAGATLVPATLLVLAWVGAVRVADGALGWAELVTTVAVVLGTFPAVLAVEEFLVDLDQAFASARRVLAVTDADPATADPAEPVALPPATGGRAVRLEDVRFTYPGAPTVDGAPVTTGRPALDGVTLAVPAGTTTALVGVSGAGKSTLVAMLLRSWDPARGRVLLDGVDVRDITLAELRANVALVPQRPYLFSGTLRTNLLVARPGATDAELDAACERARLLDVVRELPQGYDTELGEQGARLSGGQRQRVAVARAFLQDAPVIVLDEATSQLDRATQQLLQDSLTDLARGRTVIQVAHRLETVRDADQIVVMEHGRVLERGTHDELLTADGAYASLLARAGAGA